MSDPEEKETNGYSVGYRKPPAEHRFKKGQSGNPAGRRKGAKVKSKPVFKSSDKPTQSLILEEAYRPISVREGDRVIELPAIQAVLRAIGVSAMKGNRFAQKALTEIVQKVEQEHHQAQLENLETFSEYKRQWSAEFARCRQQGLPEPDQLPHPDDVIIDYRLGTLTIAGPLTKEEKARWDKLTSRRHEAQEEVLYYARMMEEEPEHKDRYRSELLFEQRIFDIINEKLPERYQKKLEGRIFEPKKQANDR